MKTKEKEKEKEEQRSKRKRRSTTHAHSFVPGSEEEKWGRVSVRFMVSLTYFASSPKPPPPKAPIFFLHPIISIELCRPHEKKSHAQSALFLWEDFFFLSP